MVLWEIALGTAYFLGLKRTYRLALRIQRRLVSPNHPKVRQFLHRRTRTIFDAALRVHRNVQERDLEVGRNVGNWILRWLDRMKPSAEIRVHPPSKPATGTGTTKHLSNSNHQVPGPSERSNKTSGAGKSDGRVFSTSLASRSKPFPTLSMMMRPLIPVPTQNQYRHLSTYGAAMLHPSISRTGAYEGVVRKDIMQWMLQN